MDYYIVGTVFFQPVSDKFLSTYYIGYLASKYSITKVLFNRNCFVYMKTAIFFLKNALFITNSKHCAYYTI